MAQHMAHKKGGGFALLFNQQLSGCRAIGLLSGCRAAVGPVGLSGCQAVGCLYDSRTV